MQAIVELGGIGRGAEDLHHPRLGRHRAEQARLDLGVRTQQLRIGHVPDVDSLGVPGRHFHLGLGCAHEHEEVPEDVLAELIEAELHAHCRYHTTAPRNTDGIARAALSGVIVHYQGTPSSFTESFTSRLATCPSRALHAPRVPESRERQ
ncbi:hypothetical protein WMF38_00930 [Sorangium sp. So ce118]